MKLSDLYQGDNDPFEGDRTLYLRSLPAGARVTRATVTLAPGLPTGRTQLEDAFIYAITFPNGQGDLGATKVAGDAFVEVDFHARRTLAQVAGAGGNSTLQVDLGGAFVGVANDGTLMAPGKTEWPVDLSTTLVALPSLTVSKFRLNRAAGNTSSLNVMRAIIRSVPTNVTMRLGQQPPFWVRLGELSVADTSPDFAMLLNVFLADAPVENGFYAIPFVVHSDTIARLDAELAIDFVIDQPVLPPHLPEVVMPYGFSTLPGVDETVTTVTLPREAIPVAGLTGAQVRGEFLPTRVAQGPIGEEPATLPVIVSPECSLAQPLQSRREIALTGIDLPLANTEPGLAGMNVAIQADADGKPFGDVLASADVRVERPLPGGSSWGSATLAAPFRILPGVRYWLVLQSRIGRAYWNANLAEPGALALQCSRDNGLSWRVANTPGASGPLAALFRLRDIPERFSVPLQLQIGKGPGAVRRLLDEFAPLGRIEFRFDFAEKLGEYLNRPEAASPCGRGELLTNGGFDQPPHDDATRRLFGFDADRDMSVVGLVDLSRGVNLSAERFILVSVADMPAVRIDCAGADPAHTTLDEIVAAINQAMGVDVASAVGAGSPSVPTYLDLGSMLSPSDIVTLHTWRQAAVPQAWQRPDEAAGQIWRVKLPVLFSSKETFSPETLPSELIVAALEASAAEPATLAQRVPASGGCTYELRFLFAGFDTAAAFYTVAAQLAALFRGTASFDLVTALAAAPASPSAAPPRWEVRWLDASDQVIRKDGAGLSLSLSPQGSHSRIGEVELRLVAPAGAAQAELRFVQPPAGFLVLDNVSFAPALDALTNGDFRRWPAGSTRAPGPPLGWTGVSGWVDALADPDGGRRLAKLRGDGIEDAILSQMAEVVAGERYDLQVRAWPESPLDGDPAAQPVQQRARLELRWLNGGPLGAPVILPLDGRDFHTHSWTGTAPAGAAHAEVRLVQPRGQGNLLVESVALVRADQIPVPLTFLAEAPGELTVSNLRVAYDLPEPPQPDGGVRAVRSIRQTEPGLVEAPAFAAAHRSPLADSRIDLVAGVGERFLEILGGLPAPITTVAELSALDPAVGIAGIPHERRLELKTAAEMILDIDIAGAPVATLADEPLDALLALAPAELAQRAGQTTAQAEQLQRKLRALRRLIKNDAFRGMRLSDVMSRAG